MRCESLRICSENLADVATLTATSAAVGAGPEWLQTEPRGEILRMLAGQGTITATWPGLVPVGLVGIPASNLSAMSRIGLRVYRDEAGTELLHDTGWIDAAPGPLLANWQPRQRANRNAYGDVLSGNDFAFGATCVAVWLPAHVLARRVEIELEDPERDHLDLARLVIGPYIAPRYGASYGATVGTQDQSSNTDTASGDVRTTRGPRRRTVGFSLDWVDERDRPMVLPLVYDGIGRRHFISLLPDHEEPTIVQTHQLWGVLRQATTMAWQAPTGHAAQFEFREG